VVTSRSVVQACAHVATSHGASTVVLDLAELRSRCAGFAHALRDIDVAMTGGSLLAPDTATAASDAGLSLGVYCEAQLTAALAARFPVERMVVHCDAGRTTLTRRAVTLGVGRFVVASSDEIDMLARMSSGARPLQVLVSIRTGAVDGVHDLTRPRGRRHGFTAGTAEADEAVRRVLACPGLRLAGAQCRLDSPFTPTAPYLQACREGLAFLRAVRDVHAVELAEIRIGGGHETLDRHRDDSAPCETSALLHRTVANTCAEIDLTAPRIAVELGDALVGPASVLLSRVHAVDRGDGQVRVHIEGGAAGLVPPAGGRSAHLLTRLSPAPDVHVEIVASSPGARGGTDTVLVPDAPLPADIAPGDLLALPSTGNAPHSALAHRMPHPALVIVVDGHATALSSPHLAEPAHRRRNVS
jgi:diaminopimelate decarboxylase